MLPTSPCILIIASVITSVVCQPLFAQDNLSDFEPFVPRTARTEADEDRILSSTRFAEGRLLFRREKFAEALKTVRARLSILQSV